MALVYPFRAFRYNPEIAPFDRVLTQPYDKISPAQQEKYYAADPHNLITVEKGRSFPEDTPQNNVYTRAAAALKNWIAGTRGSAGCATRLLCVLTGIHDSWHQHTQHTSRLHRRGKARRLCERSGLPP